MNVDGFLERAWQKVDEVDWHERQEFRGRMLEASRRAGVPTEERVLTELARSQQAGWDTSEQGFLTKGELVYEAWTAIQSSADPAAFLGRIEGALEPEEGPEGTYSALAARWADLLRRAGRAQVAEPWFDGAKRNLSPIEAFRRIHILRIFDEVGVDGREELWEACFRELPSSRFQGVIRDLLGAGDAERAILAVRTRDDLSGYDIEKCAGLMADAGRGRDALDLLGRLDAKSALRAAKTLAKLGEPGIRLLLSHLEGQSANFDSYNAYELLAQQLESAEYAAKALDTMRAMGESNAVTLARVARLCLRFDVPEFEAVLLPMAADPGELRARLDQLRSEAEVEDILDGPSASMALTGWLQPGNAPPTDGDRVAEVIAAAVEDPQADWTERARRRDLAVSVLCRLSRIDAAEEMARAIANEGKRAKVIRDFERGALVTVAAAHVERGAYAKALELLGEAEELTKKFGLNRQAGGETKIYEDWLRVITAVSEQPRCARAARSAPVARVLDVPAP